MESNVPQRPGMFMSQTQSPDNRSDAPRNAVTMMTDVINVVEDRKMVVKGYYLLGEANFQLEHYSLARKNYRIVYEQFPKESRK
jgi:hypothetical protein